MGKITKKSLNAFIDESAEMFGNTREEYLENAKKNYVILDSEKNPICWEDGTLMVMNSLNGAMEEAEIDEKVVSEFDFYTMRKAI